MRQTSSQLIATSLWVHRGVSAFAEGYSSDSELEVDFVHEALDSDSEEEYDIMHINGYPFFLRFP